MAKKINILASGPGVGMNPNATRKILKKEALKIGNQCSRPRKLDEIFDYNGNLIQTFNQHNITLTTTAATSTSTPATFNQIQWINNPITYADNKAKLQDRAAKRKRIVSKQALRLLEPLRQHFDLEPEGIRTFDNETLDLNCKWNLRGICINRPDIMIQIISLDNKVGIKYKIKIRGIVFAQSLTLSEAVDHTMKLIAVAIM